MKDERHTSAYRSLFIPLLLIGGGVMWLLANFDLIGVQNIVMLARLWPLLLIAAGLDMLAGRRWPALGALIGVGTVALVIVLMLIGPALGWGYNIETTLLSDTEPVGNTERMQVILDAKTGQINVAAITDSNRMIDFDLKALGAVDYHIDGETQKVIRLSQNDYQINGLAAFIASLFGNADYRWNVRLTPRLPVELRVSNSTGSAQLDLRGLNLNKLSLSMATGSIDLMLPAAEQPYEANISSATGGGSIFIEEGAQLFLKVSVATGGYTIDVPDGAAVRVRGSVAVGRIEVPAQFRRISGDTEKFTGEEGVWETENFSSATKQIFIDFDGATGGLTVK